jgi:hypothetical protein
MSAYRKFVDTLQSGPRTPAPPKPPNAPKANPSEPVSLPVLGGLGALGALRPGTLESPSAPASAELIAPSSWFECVARPGEGEPGFEHPYAARRGRVEERDGVFVHFCAECGRWGAYGYGVNLRAGRLGHWYCAAHRPKGIER